MGNYYEGVLEFRLKKNLALDDLKDFILLSSDIEKRILYSEKIQKSKWFSHENWSRPDFELKRIYENSLEQDKYQEKILVDVDEDEKLNQRIDSSWIFIGYEFSVRFCMTGYRKDGQDLGLLITQYIKPMCDISLYSETAGYLGTVIDEDETYKRDFYLDEAAFQKECFKREYLCNSCKNKNKYSLCSYWDFCFRAYEIGKQK